MRSIGSVQEMGGNDEGWATLTVGPASEGVVRILVRRGGGAMAMDCEPDEAGEIPGQRSAAAARACGAGRRGSERGSAGGVGRSRGDEAAVGRCATGRLRR